MDHRGAGGNKALGDVHPVVHGKYSTVSGASCGRDAGKRQGWPFSVTPEQVRGDEKTAQCLLLPTVTIPAHGPSARIPLIKPHDPGR